MSGSRRMAKSRGFALDRGTRADFEMDGEELSGGAGSSTLEVSVWAADVCVA